MKSKSVKFAVFQSKLEALDVQSLKQAYRDCPSCRLTDFDAMVVAEQGFGVLANYLSQDTALALCKSLEKQGIGAEAVPEKWLKLPQAFHLRDLNVKEEGFCYSDYLNRVFTIDWGRVTAVGLATFNVEKRVVVKEAQEDYVSTDHGTFRMNSPAQWGLSGSSMLVVDILLQAPVARLRIEPVKLKNVGSFRLVLKDFLSRCPHAALSLGATEFCDGAEYIPEYKQEKYFENHLTWLNWKYVQVRRQYSDGNSPARELKIHRKLEIEPRPHDESTLAPVINYKAAKTKTVAKNLPIADRPASMVVPEDKQEEIVSSMKRTYERERDRMRIPLLILGGMTIGSIAVLGLLYFMGVIPLGWFRLLYIAVISFSGACYRYRKYWFY